MTRGLDVNVLTAAPDGSPIPPLLHERDGAYTRLTCPACGRSVSFVSPTPERVQGYVTSHRCGPGRTWQGV